MTNIQEIGFKNPQTEGQSSKPESIILVCTIKVLSQKSPGNL